MEAGATPDNREAPASSSQTREILDLAIPAMLAIASEPILSLADTAMIGRLGVEPLAAKAIGSALIGGIYWIFTFLVFGTTTLVGYHHGANEQEECGEVCLHALFLAMVGGMAVLSLGILFAPYLYAWMGAREEVLVDGTTYFRIRIAGTPFTFFFYVTVGFLRGIQNTRTPMVIAFAVNGLNLILDYVLIYGEFGFPAMGLQGAAVAALAAQVIGGVICLTLLFSSSYTSRYGLTHWRFTRRRITPLFLIGRDLAIRTGALRFSLVFATATVGRMGTGPLSSHEIAFQLWLLCSDAIDGLAVAGQVLVAKYLGGNLADKAYRMGKILILCGLTAGLVFAVGYLWMKQPMIALFTKNPGVVWTLSGGIFLFLALFQPLNGIVYVLDGFLIGANDTRFLMWAMLIGGLGIFIPVAWISLQWDFGLLGVWTGLCLLMAWRLVTNLFRFFSRHWISAFPGSS
ncbi:MAG: MATE family efflux transporter [Candidatus Binatia bacterium]